MLNRKGYVMPFLLAGFLAGATAFAQTPGPDQKDQAVKTQGETGNASEKERAKELEKKALALVDDALKESQGLKLSENRITLQADAADLLWKHDQKRARALFKAAVDGLVEMQRQDQQAALSLGDTYATFSDGLSQNASQYVELSMGQQARAQLRQQILTMVARRDAKLLREFLAATVSGSGSPDTQSAYMDRHLEISLASQLVETDPGEAVKVAEQSLDRGFHFELPSVVGQLLQKDKDSGNKLVSLIINKLRSEAVNKNDEAPDFGASLLSVLLGKSAGPGFLPGGSATPVADERLIRELMEIVVTMALSAPDSRAGASRTTEADDEDDEDGEDWDDESLLFRLKTMLPEVQRYAPTRYASLKMRIEEEEKNLSPRERAQLEAATGSTMLEAMTSGSVESMLSAAEKSQGEQKQALYLLAAMQLAATGDVEGANRIAEEQITDSNKRGMLGRLISAQAASQAAQQGNLDQARQALNALPASERASAILNFALSALNRGDKKQAAALLEEARGLMGPTPNDAAELRTHIEMAGAYSSAGSAAGFEMMERIIEQLNGLVAALSVIDRFEHIRRFRDGELMLSGQNQSQIVSAAYRCASVLAASSRTDFDRARACSDRFEPLELKLFAKMAVAKGILSEASIYDVKPSAVPFMMNPQFTHR